MNQVLLLTALILTSNAAVAEEMREWIPYQRLAEASHIDKFHAAPVSQRDKLLIYPILTPSNKLILPSAVVLAVQHAQGRQAMPVGADGRVDFTFNAKWVSEGAILLINQPKGEKIGVGFGLDAAMPPGLSWQYATLMGSVQQANELIKNQAGALSLFAPKMRSVKLTFSKPAQLLIRSSKGVIALSSDARHVLQLLPDPVLMQENPLMVLSERPLAAELDTR